MLAVLITHFESWFSLEQSCDIAWGADRHLLDHRVCFPSRETHLLSLNSCTHREPDVLQVLLWLVSKAGGMSI